MPVKVQVRGVAAEAVRECERTTTFEDQIQVPHSFQYLPHQTLVERLTRSQSSVAPYTTVGSHASNASLRTPLAGPRSGLR